jgi:hypothetical protein
MNAEISKLSREDRQSYRLNKLGIETSRKDWENALVIIKRNLETMRSADSGDPRYILRWQELLSQGPEAVSKIILGINDEAQVLRSFCPFGGILNEEERLKIIRESWTEAR